MFCFLRLWSPDRLSEGWVGVYPAPMKLLDTENCSVDTCSWTIVITSRVHYAFFYLYTQPQFHLHRKNTIPIQSAFQLHSDIGTCPNLYQGHRIQVWELDN